MKDRFEPEYPISKDNLAILAYAGDGSFNGYIRKECLELSRVKWIIKILLHAQLEVN